MFASIILGALVYIAFIPFIFLGLPKLVRKAIEQSRRRPAIRRQPKLNEKPKVSFFLNVVLHIKFGLKNAMPCRNIFAVVYFLGLVATVVLFAESMYLYGVVTSFVFPITAGLYMFKATDRVYSEQERVVNRLADIARSALGSKEENVAQIAEVTEWEDLVVPLAVKFYIPTVFRSEGEQNFMRLLNQNFGSVSTWVPDEDKGGWDYDKGLGFFRVKPPLPTLAPWKEEYAIGPEIAESFFPVAVGVEGGIELTDSETGNTFNLLGYDVAGETKGKVKELGIKADESLLSAAPHVLVGGGTGGGKSLSLEERILVYRKC